MTMKYSTKLGGEQIRHMSTGCQSDLSGEPHFQISHLSSFTFHIFHDLSHVPASVRLIFFLEYSVSLIPSQKINLRRRKTLLKRPRIFLDPLLSAPTPTSKA